MSHTPSPITPASDQDATIHLLETFGDEFGVDVDAGPLDVAADQMCAHDWQHGWATVCTQDGDVTCPACARDWIRWHTGAYVSLDVLAVPTTVAVAA